MRYGKNIFLEQYDPTIEGTSPISRRQSEAVH